MKLALNPDFKRLMDLAQPHWRKLLLAGVCMIGIAGFTALSVYIIKPAMDDIFGNRDIAMLRIMPFAILGVFLFKGRS